MELLSDEVVVCEVLLSPAQGKLRASLYELQAIETERLDDQGNWILNIRLPRREYQRLFGPDFTK